MGGQNSEEDARLQFAWHSASAGSHCILRETVFTVVNTVPPSIGRAHFASPKVFRAFYAEGPLFTGGGGGGGGTVFTPTPAGRTSISNKTFHTCRCDSISH